jgi:hypothetical protein
MNTKEWRKLIGMLRKTFPVNGKVIVRRYPMKKTCGITRFNGSGEYRIGVGSNQPRVGQMDTLIHEWAHVLAIQQAYTHDGPWGVLFAEVYDSWSRDFGEKNAVHQE